MLVLLALAVASASPSPPPAPAPTPTPGLFATFAPSVTPTATPVYNFVYRQPPSPGSTPFPVPGAPEIIEIDVTDQTIAVPGPLHVRILTSDSVVTVVAQSFGYEVGIPQRSRGTFAYDGILPVVPDMAKGRRFDVDVIATSKDGRTATITLPFMLK